LVAVVTDRVFDECESTTDIFQELISPIIESGMEGINGQYVYNIAVYTVSEKSWMGRFYLCRDTAKCLLL